MARAPDDLLSRLEAQPQSIRFAELRALCEQVFGAPRRSTGSHLVFKTGLRTPALVNIQPRGKMAKPYQCRQVAAAIRALAGRER